MQRLLYIYVPQKNNSLLFNLNPRDETQTSQSTFLLGYFVLAGSASANESGGNRVRTAADSSFDQLEAERSLARLSDGL